MKSGTVKLVNARDQLLKEEKYKSTEQWKRIIEGWQFEYGHNFQFCFIQFCPDAYPTDTLLPYKKEKKAHKAPQLLLNERRSIRAVFK